MADPKKLIYANNWVVSELYPDPFLIMVSWKVLGWIYLYCNWIELFFKVPTFTVQQVPAMA